MKRWAVVLVVLGLLVALTAPAAVAGVHKTGKPFVGFVGGHSSWYTNPMGCGMGATTITEARGLATPFGRVTLHMEHCPTMDASTDGEFVLTASNGDTIFGTYKGDPPDDFSFDAEIGSWFHGQQTMVITGGTGRYAGATGTATMQDSHRFDGMPDPEWPFLAYWYGRVDF